MPAAAPENAAFRVVVTGRVQGVGFRYSTVREARALGVRGTVANRADGDVEVYAEGAKTDLGRLLEWLRRGPPGAHVGGVQVDWLPWTGHCRDFDVDF
jgi:acylphosphatase